MNEEDERTHTHALTVRPPSHQEMLAIARAAASSNYFPNVNRWEQAYAKMRLGAELGIQPFAALQGIDIIENRTSFSAALIGTLIQTSDRFSYRVREYSDKACSIEFFERGESLGTERYTIEEAQRAGLTNKPSWRGYPRAMLRNRAIRQGAYTFCPGVFRGHPVYTPEELGNETPDHNDPLRTNPFADDPSDVEGTAREVTEPDLLTTTQRDAINRAFTQLGWSAPKRGAWLREGYSVGLNQLTATDADEVGRLLRAELVTAGLEPPDTDAEATEIEVTATELNERTE